MFVIVCVIILVAVVIFCSSTRDGFSLKGSNPPVSGCLKNRRKQAYDDCYGVVTGSGYCLPPGSWAKKQCGYVINPCVEPQFKRRYLKSCYDYCMVECGNWKPGCASKCLKETGYNPNANYPPPKLCELCKKRCPQSSERCQKVCSVVC